MQHDYSGDDLDRTEELPVLDVEAYEASLAASENDAQRTSSATAELSTDVDEDDVDEDGESPEPEAEIVSHDLSRTRHGSEALTANVERILKRIADLEADANAAHEANATLVARTDALQVERDEQARRIESLEAETARLHEHRTVAEELSRQLAAKLSECDRLASVVRLRDGAIDDLTRARDELAARVDTTEQSLREREEALRGREALIAERDAVIAEKDGQLADQAKDLEYAARELAAERGRREAVEESLSALEATRSRSLEELAQRDGQITALRADLEQALRARDEIAEGVRTQLESAREEHAAISSQMDMVQARMRSLRRQLFSKDAQIAQLQDHLAVHTEALAAIDRDVNRIGKDAEAESFAEIERVLEPLEHGGDAIVLTGKMLTVGRTAENDVCIPSNLISRHHARFLMGPTGVIIEDAGSTNGCFVNGEQVRHRLMRDGDVLGLGALHYRLRTRSAEETRAQASLEPTLNAVDRKTDRRTTFIPKLVQKNAGVDRTDVNKH